MRGLLLYFFNRGIQQALLRPLCRAALCQALPRGQGRRSRHLKPSERVKVVRITADINNSISRLCRYKSLPRKMSWKKVMYISLYFTFSSKVDSTWSVTMYNSKTVESPFVFSKIVAWRANKYSKQGTDVTEYLHYF